jgi:hypothetical protein
VLQITSVVGIDLRLIVLGQAHMLFH